MVTLPSVHDGILYFKVWSFRNTVWFFHHFFPCCPHKYFLLYLSERPRHLLCTSSYHAFLLNLWIKNSFVCILYISFNQKYYFGWALFYLSQPHGTSNNLLFNPNKAGGPLCPPPSTIFSDCSGTHMDGAPPLADCFLLSLAQLLKYFFWKSDLRLQGHVTFCLCMSARKSLIFVICVQNIWKSHFS